MTKSEMLKELAWEDFTIQSQFHNSYMLILICKNKTRALSLMEFMKTSMHTVRESMNTETLEYSIHFILRTLVKAWSIKPVKAEKMYPPLKWLGNGLLHYITTGYMNTPQQVSAFQPIALASTAHPN